MSDVTPTDRVASEPSRDRNAMTPAEELDDMSDWAAPEEEREP